MASREASIVQGCIDEAHLWGAWVQKFHGSKWTSRGIPDLLICMWGLLIAVECKKPGAEPTASQRLVHARIRRAGGTVIVAHSRAELRTSLVELAVRMNRRVPPKAAA